MFLRVLIFVLCLFFRMFSFRIYEGVLYLRAFLPAFPAALTFLPIGMAPSYWESLSSKVWPMFILMVYLKSWGGCRGWGLFLGDCIVLIFLI
jgi:hypothetical protein